MKKLILIMLMATLAGCVEERRYDPRGDEQPGWDFYYKERAKTDSLLVVIDSLEAWGDAMFYRWMNCSSDSIAYFLGSVEAQ